VVVVVVVVVVVIVGVVVGVVVVATGRLGVMFVFVVGFVLAVSIGLSHVGLHGNIIFVKTHTPVT